MTFDDYGEITSVLISRGGEIVVEEYREQSRDPTAARLCSRRALDHDKETKR